MLNKLYWALGLATIAFYSLSVAMGWEFLAPQRRVLAGDTRQGAGYLSSSYRGGK